MVIDKNTDKVIWFSLSSGFIDLFGALTVPITIHLLNSIHVDLGINTFRGILGFVILYVGRISFNFFKNKNKWFYYNSIFIILRGLMELALMIISILFPNFVLSQSGKTNLILAGVIAFTSQIIYGASWMINGIQLIKHTKLPNFNKMRKLSLYLLLITLITFIFAVIISIYDFSGSTLQNQTFDDKHFNNPLLGDLGFVFEGIATFSLSIGISMLIMSFITPLFFRKI